MELVKNSSMIIIAMFIANFLAWVFHVVVARSLGVSGYGEFGALLTLFMIAGLPAGAINNAIAKFSSKLNTRQEYSKIGLLRKSASKRVWIFSIILFIMICIFSSLIADYLKLNSFIPIIFVGITIVFSFVLPVNRGILQGMKKFKYYSINLIIEALSRLVLVMLLLFIGLGVDGVILAYGLGYFIAYLLIFPYLKDTKLSSKDNINLKPIYKYILIVILTSFLFNLILNLPIIFIKHIYSSEFTGYFTCAITIAKITLFVASGISTVMFSEIAGHEDKKEKRKIFLKSLILTVLAASGVAIVAMIFPNLIIGILFGKEFLPAAPILQWLEIGMVLLSVLQLFVSYWLATLDENKKWLVL